MRSKLGLGIGILSLCAAMGFVGFAGVQSYGYGVDIFRAYVSSTNWQRTRGVIVNSSAQPGCGRVGVGHYLKVRYAYLVEGQEHSNDRVWFGNGYCAGRIGAESMASKYVIGTSIDVYFNPASPSESVLVRGRVENGTVFLFVLLLCPPIGAIVLFIKAVGQSKRHPPSDIDARLRRAQSLDRGIRLEIEERKNASEHVAPSRDA